MSDFLEKLKKGMNIKETPEIDNLDNFDDIDSSDNQPPEINFASLEKKQTPTTIKNTKVKTSSIKKPGKENEPDVSIAKKKTLKKTSAKNPKNASEKQKEKSTKKKKTRTKKTSAGSNSKKIKVKKDVSGFKTSSSAQVSQSETWAEEKQMGQLVIDLYETGKEIVIQSAIAGVGPENLDILIENDMVKIKGYREKISEEEGRSYFYQECHWGPFSREIILPVEVNSGQAQAIMKNGILTIRIPKIEKVARKKLIIKEE